MAAGATFLCVAANGSAPGFLRHAEAAGVRVIDPDVSNTVGKRTVIAPCRLDVVLRSVDMRMFSTVMLRVPNRI